ncbi:hypothetical protein HK098_002082 [Nowakowskiella sp. JEL0407]|nr:hypothetical protein HK098_002082 [Nowakowskiella sp. JEL0407]
MSIKFNPLHIDLIKTAISTNDSISITKYSSSKKFQDIITTYHDENENNLVNFACGFKSSLIVNTLVHYGANPSLPNKYGWTPLHTASYNGHLEVIQSLLKIASVKPTVNNATVFGFSPLMLAIQQSHYEVTWFFLKIASGMEYLGGVGAAGRVNVNRVVVPVTTSVPSATTTNSNLNSNNSSSSSNTRNIKNSKLQLQVGIGYTPLMISCLNCDVDSTVLLLEYGAEVNAQCKLNGWTAIMYAIVGEIKKRGHGLAQNVENKDELKSGNGGSNFNTLDRRLAVIKLLLEFGADPGLMNWESKSAMDLAVDLGEYDLLDVSTLGLGVDMSMPTDKKTNSVGISNKYEEKDLPTCGCFDGFKCLWDRNPQTRISPLQDTKVNYEITNFPRSQTRKARLFLESTDDIGQGLLKYD